MNFANAKEIKLNNKKVKSIDINGKRAWSAIKTFTITYDLINCSSSNMATTITEGSSYTSNISCTSAYILQDCKVTMGGVYLSSAFQQTGGRKGTITIANVTGDIVIYAEADN